jgi:hypothetical protein
MALPELSTVPCCEINKLIVQVVGKSHPDAQRLAFYEHDSLKRLDALTDSDRPESLTSDSLVISALHVWSWSNTVKHRLWIEIASVEGPPIRVPLPPVSITTREFDGQWNQIVPIVPFVALPGVNSSHDKGTPVLCRSGFIYVFLDGRVWRELEVRVDDERTTYHDVDFNQYRMGDVIEPHPRLATGQALEDIWLPSNWNNGQISPQLCFSEVQLNAPRLHRLEQDSELRAQRCQSPDLRSSLNKFKQVFKNKPDGTAMLEAFSDFDIHAPARQSEAGLAQVAWLNLKKHAFPVSIVAPQRARQPGFEWMLDQPARYLCDLSGQFPVLALSKAHQHFTTCERGDEVYRPTWVETGAWAHWLELACTVASPLAHELWAEQPALPDALHSARKRELYGVLLEDPYYRQRHLRTRLDDQRHLLQLCAARASRYAHHASALLVQQLIVPREISGGPNPMHQKLDVLKLQGRLDLNRFTASSERLQLWNALDMTQSLLADWLKAPTSQHTLADHLALDGFEYAAALHAVSQLFTSLAILPAQLDPLAVNGEIGDAVAGVSSYHPKCSVGQRLISEIANGEQHMLHLMLWPDLAVHDLGTPYIQPPLVEANLGDGSFRGAELAQTGEKPIPHEARLISLDAQLLSALLTSGSLNTGLTTLLKGVANSLVNVFENLHGAVEAAERAIQAANNIQIPMAERKTSVLNQALQRRALAQMRATVPSTFGDAVLISHADALTKDYYVFGLSDLPTKSTQVHNLQGEHRGASGHSIGPSPTYQAQLEISADSKVVAMPRGHRTAQTISLANKQINAAWQQDLAEQNAATKVKTSALENAVGASESLKKGHVYRALGSVPFAGAGVMLEMWNVRNEIAGRLATEREKGPMRAMGGLAGAGVDLVLALEFLTMKVAGSQSVWAAGRKPIFVISEAFAKRALGSMSEYFVKELSARAVAQIVAGLIFAAINLSDAWDAYQVGDNVMWGYLLMAASGIVGAFGTLMVSGGATFLGLTPVGWAVLISLGAGIAATVWLSKKPIEDWLSLGPFADPDNAVAHLQDPKQALYRLVGLLADIRIAITANPEYEFNARMDTWETTPFDVRQSETLIRIESNVPGLMNDLGVSGIHVKVVQEKNWALYDIWSGVNSELKELKPVLAPNAYRKKANTMEMFFKACTRPEVERARHLGVQAFRYRYLVRAQVTINEGDTQWVFPAPPPKDPITFGPAYANANFQALDQLFWADETTHKAPVRP